MRIRKPYRSFVGEELQLVVGRKIISKSKKIEYLITGINAIDNTICIDDVVWIPSSDLLDMYNFINNKICGKVLKDECKKEVMV
jgi:hypothetical protein